LYNSANYIIRQEFFKNKKWIRCKELDKLMQNHTNYKELGSQASQNTLKLIDKNWKSFYVASDDYKRKNGKGYFGEPKIPEYKHKKKGRSILMVKNIQCRINNGKLLFSWKPLKILSGTPTKVDGKLQQVRFVPMGDSYVMEIVYLSESPEAKDFNNRIIGIDLGVNNFITIGNNAELKSVVIKGGEIKSMNQWYNKERARIASETRMIWNRRMRLLTDKHLRKTRTYMHKISKFVVNYCVDNNIDTIIIGKSKEWKDGINLGHVNNQNFVCIPYEKLIDQIRYKSEDKGIRCIVNEEDFTSGTSFLDNELPTEENYNIKRRIKRGLFKSNDGTLINADLNATYQIIKKVYPSAFVETQNGGSRGCDLHPTRLMF
jgi:putative transposase